MKKTIKALYHLLRSLLSMLRLSKINDGSLIILTYHRILPDTHKDCSLEQPGMILSPDNLDMQLRLLLKYATPILIDDWIRKQQQHELDKNLYFAVTFDDGWKDNYDYAVSVLKKYDIPATIFLVSKMVNSNHNFWPGRLANLIQIIAESPSINMKHTEIRKLLDINTIINIKEISNNYIDQMITNAKQFSDLEIHDMIDSFYQLNPSLIKASDRVILNFEEIADLEDIQLINFGSHTQTHQRLTRLASQNVLEKEIITSKHDLEAISHKISDIFCYPNGDTCPQSEQLVRENYAGACTTQKGINRPGNDHYKLKRFNLHNGNSNFKQRFFSSLLD